MCLWVCVFVFVRFPTRVSSQSLGVWVGSWGSARAEVLSKPVRIEQGCRLLNEGRGVRIGKAGEKIAIQQRAERDVTVGGGFRDPHATHFGVGKVKVPYRC